MKYAMSAIIKKDFRGVASNRKMFSSLLIVPIALIIVMPSIMVFAVHFAPDDPDIMKMMELLPQAVRPEDMETAVIGLLLNYLLPVFFLLIPIMTASIMAASSFVGEKEKRTLETLLYCPLSLRKIFQAKVLASFLLSMMVSLFSFAAMLLVMETEIFFLTGALILPGVSWAVILLLVSPAISLIAITFIVKGSAKARSMEESQQSAVFLVIPVLLLIVSQVTGIMLLNIWILLGLGGVCALLAGLLLKKSMNRFTYERLLR